MTDQRVRKILIVGGGTAGWITAAALSALYAAKDLQIELVESEAIGTVGVGEATVPHIRYFNERIGVDEREFMLKTAATFKLGIEFRDWGRIGDSYVHPFGDFGQTLNGVKFHQAWRRARAAGDQTPIFDYSLPAQMALAGRFAMPSSDTRSIQSTFSYAYQFDANLYAAYLRGLCEQRGVMRHEGRIVGVEQDPDTGFVRGVTLESGARLEGDLYIDCSGFRGLLIEETLKTGYDDWSRYLPCDRAWAAPCAATEAGGAYTRATAREAGWQWRIPLQHRVGNGYVFSTRFTTEAAARELLLRNLESPPLAEPRLLRFTTGVRRKSWNRNVVAIGLSSGFLEPLESTSIHLIQLAITYLAELMPDLSFRPEDEAEYNRAMAREFEVIRDFLILHYHATERDDTPFWTYCRTMEIPDSLRHKMDLFRDRGVVVNYKEGFFHEPSWVAVYLGQRIEPDDFDPLTARLGEAQLTQTLERLRAQVREAVAATPLHQDFLNDYCPFPPRAPVPA